MLSQLSAVNGGDAGLPAAAAGLHDDADRAGRPFRVRKVGPDQRMVRVELLGRAVQAVAVFGDGQADDADLRLVDRVQQSGAGLAGEHHVGQRTDDGNGLFAALRSTSV